jgi:TonB family protein
MVGKDGRVSNVTVLRGPQIFRRAAVDAILQYRFKPSKQNGKPVNVWLTQPMTFRLNKKNK